MTGGWTGAAVRRAAIDVACAVGLGAFMAFIGPFGNYAEPSLPLRLTYWIGAFLLGLALYRAALWAADRMGAPAGLPAWFRWAAAALAATVPLAAATHAVAGRLWPAVAQIPALSWWTQVAVLSAPLLILERLVPRRPPTVRPAPGGTPRFTDVICLQMEDHYVRVHTQRGSELVLMRLSDAIAATGAARGLQTHRSWWVARGSVAAVVQDGRNVRLKLANGIEAPVSRSAVAKLRAEGLLPPTA
jgi:hypothetical protein